MCKARGILSFALIHMSCRTYFCKKSSFLLLFFPSICMPFTISHFYFNFSIVPVGGRLEDIGKSLHSKVKRFKMQTCCYLLESLTCNPPGPFWTQLFYQETFVPNLFLPSWPKYDSQWPLPSINNNENNDRPFSFLVSSKTPNKTRLISQQ